jgi:hypothetical protein
MLTHQKNKRKTDQDEKQPEERGPILQRFYFEEFDAENSVTDKYYSLIKSIMQKNKRK